MLYGHSPNWVNQVYMCLCFIFILLYIISAFILLLCDPIFLTFEIIVKPGRLNAGPDHLSRLESSEEPISLEDCLSNVQLFSIQIVDDQFPDIIHFLTTGTTPKSYTMQQKKQLVVCATDFTLIAGQLYKLGPDETLRRYVLEHEQRRILEELHARVAGGHYAGKPTTQKVLTARLWWPAVHKDAKEFCRSCDVC